MSIFSSEYLDKAERCILGGVPINELEMTVSQRFRIIVVQEAFQEWKQNKHIDSTKILSQISKREYYALWQFASQGNTEAQKYVEALNIHTGWDRTIGELLADVSLLNYIVGEYNASTPGDVIAKLNDAADWLIATGQTSNIKEGYKIKNKIGKHINYDDFI